MMKVALTGCEVLIELFVYSVVILTSVLLPELLGINVEGSMSLTTTRYTGLSTRNIWFWFFH